MTIEANFNPNEAHAELEAQITSGQRINPYYFSQVILRIHLGSNWQDKNGLTLNNDETNELITLQYLSPSPNRKLEFIQISVDFDGAITETLNLGHLIDSQEEEKFPNFLWIPSAYPRMVGGNRITEGYFKKAQLDQLSEFTLACKIWCAHQYTLEGKKAILFHPDTDLKVDLPTNIQN